MTQIDMTLTVTGMPETSEISVKDSTPQEILHPGSRTLFRYWESVRGEDAAPVRSKLDLKQVRSLVPWLAIVERHDDRQIYTWRLAGTGVERLWGRSLTGTEVANDWDAFERQTLVRLLDGVVGGLQPCVARMRASSQSGEQIGIEMLALPVRCANASRHQVFASIVPFRDPEWLQHEQLVKFELSAARVIWTEPVPGSTDLINANDIPPWPRNNTGAFLRVIRGGRED